MIVALAAVVVIVIVASTLGSGIAGNAGGDGSAPSPLSSLLSIFDNVPAPGAPMKSNSITNDPGTWPSGDQIWLVCCAIASAEGANVSGSVPDRLNNPGDISDGGSTYPQESHNGSSVTHFPDKATGWQWLYNKVQNIQQGNSSVYFPDMTWTQIAQKWAGNSAAWVANVTAFLGVDPNSKFSDFTG